MSPAEDGQRGSLHPHPHVAQWASCPRISPEYNLPGRSPVSSWLAINKSSPLAIVSGPSSGLPGTPCFDHLWAFAQAGSSALVSSLIKGPNDSACQSSTYKVLRTMLDIEEEMEVSGKALGGG